MYAWLSCLPHGAVAELEVMSYSPREEPDIADRRVVDGRHEAVHCTGVAAHHAVFERDAHPELGIEAVGVDEGVGDVLGRMAGAAGVYPITRLSAGEAGRVLVGVEDQVVAALDCPHELAVVPEILDFVLGAELVPARLGRYLRAERLHARPEMRPEDEPDDQADERQHAFRHLPWGARAVLAPAARVLVGREIGRAS